MTAHTPIIKSPTSHCRPLPAIPVAHATAAELSQVIQNHRRICQLIALNYKKNVMSNMRRTHQWVQDADRPNIEFLFLLEK